MRLSQSLVAAAVLIAAVPAAAAPDRASPAAARLTVERYYAAIDRGDFRTAYALWDRDGRASGQRYAAFRAGFARTARSRVTTATPVDQEGAAGSSYITVPVDVRATLKTGARQHFRGQYILRRVNDIDGATAADLSWHIASAKLSAVH